MGAEQHVVGQPSSISQEQLTAIATQIQALIQQSTLPTATIPVSSAWNIFQVGLTGIISIVEAIAAPAIGAEKKVIALEGARRFYVGVVAPMDMPYVPNLIEPMVDAVLEKVFVKLAGGSIDALVYVMNTLGVFKK